MPQDAPVAIDSTHFGPQPVRIRVARLVPVLLALTAVNSTPSFAAPFAPTFSLAPALATSTVPQADSGPGSSSESALRSITARVDVVRGRATLASEMGGMATLRRGSAGAAAGEAQLEVATGCQVRVSLDGEVTLDVFGPSALEWRRGEEGILLVFRELGWVDVDVRSGEHAMALPADWSARFGRSSFHLRALAGGPTELRHDAGSAITLDWRGDQTRVRPPVSVYPGSSIRLDRPRHDRIEELSADQNRAGAWQTDEVKSWPWRERTDSAAQVMERAVLHRETQVLDEIPGDPSGEIARVRAYQFDGSSHVRPLRRQRDDGQTYAQVPVGPGGRTGETPRVEILTLPGLTDFTRVDLPRRPDNGPSFSSLAGADRGIRAPGTGLDEPTHSSDQSRNTPGITPIVLPKMPFDASHWRGLALASLNGVGEIAAERGSGVEVRALGGGRLKVFVSASSPSPRWCFAPGHDYLLSPGAVAVFEPSGEVRMSFGEIEEKAPIVGRPSFSQLEK